MVGRMASVANALLAASLLLATTSAIPAVVFPFNSQVPTAARVNQPYVFQFSAATFAPADESFIYSLTGQPAWLSLDGVSRTLIGTPGTSDAGSSTFTLTAAGNTGAAHMQCTLVVAVDPLPTLQGDLGDQFAQSANLSSSSPATMTLSPGSAFNFHFRQNSFIDIVQRSLYYYATLTDHTPLPAWLHFDPEDLMFSGVAPQLSAFSQAFEILLITSDVPGFAGSSATFTIRIRERVLIFVPEEKEVTVKRGETVEIGDLGDALLSNSVKMDLAKLKSAEAADLPGWLTFDGKTLGLKGTAPDNAEAANITVTVRDQNDDTATAVVRLVADNDDDDNDKSLFAGKIGTLEATPGEAFDYIIPTSVVADGNTSLILVLPTEARWLAFDSGNRELKGDVPTEASIGVAGTLVARAPNAAETESQVFEITFKDKTQTSESATTLITSITSPTGSATSSAAALAEGPSSDHGLHGRTIAGIVVGVVLAVAILLALLFLCCRKRRDREGYEKQTSPSKRAISRPIPPPGIHSIAVTTRSRSDMEKADPELDERAEGDELPPRIDLTLPPPSVRNSKWTSRLSHISMASSIGRGEDMIRADSNIPEWGQESAALQKPHDSFSVPAQMARISREPSDISPSKRTFQRLRDKRARHRSEDAIGLGIGGADGAALSPSRTESRRKANSLGAEAMLDRSKSRNSRASALTQSTGVLSLESSKFPRPPTHSSFGGSRSFLAGLGNDKRKSVRLVARSDSAATEHHDDGRSHEEKRKSYFNKRPSRTLSSPLWAASLGDPRNHTAEVDTGSGNEKLQAKHNDSLPTSSSKLPSVPSRSSMRFSQRFRTTFAPSYPRAVSPVGDKRSVMKNDRDNETDWETSSESDSTTDREADRTLAEEMTLPRHERPWVLPNEASPTPSPPISMARRQFSTSYRSTLNSRVGKAQPWNTPSSRSVSRSSPLVLQALKNTSPAFSPLKVPASRCNRVSEPMALRSTDILSKAKVKLDSATPERPRLSHTKSGRPISVEDVQRLSSLRADRVREEDVTGGVTQDDERGRIVTGARAISGKAFL